MTSAAPDAPGGARAMKRLDDLARFSDEPGAITRLYLSPAHVAAATRVGTWMEDAGMSVHFDAAGNVIGRYEGSDRNAPAVLIGSHIDTVPDGGRYDGTLGVVVAIEVVAALHACGARMPFPIDVIAFGDEEGVRFPATLTGSKAVSGTLEQAMLDARDVEGISIRDALATFGCPPDIQSAAYRRDAVQAYLEVHIEQGPILEAKGLPLGTVTAIAGATRAHVVVTGTAGHAGTVPMNLRRDAVAAAAEMILAVEQAGVTTDDVIATVGSVHVPSGAVNVVAAQAEFTIDLRSPSNRLRLQSFGALREQFADIAQRRRVEFHLDVTYDQPAAPCDPHLVDLCGQAVRALGVRPFKLASGAGHDGLAMAALCPIAMLFVRCGGGISHNPAESVRDDDVDLAISALLELLRSMSTASSAIPTTAPPGRHDAAV